MKARLARKNTVKFMDSHFTPIEIKERKEAENDYNKCKTNIRTS